MPDYRKAAQAAAQRHGLGDWFVRQINQESGFNPGASSGAGAQGIAQIVPKWHPDAPSAAHPLDQLDWAANYMSGLVKQHGGNVAQALSVYNSGRPDKYLDPNFAGGQTYNYVKNILGGSKPLATPTSLPAPTAPPRSVPLGGPALPKTAATAPPLPPSLAGAVLANLGQTDPAKQLANLTSFVASQPPPGMTGTPPPAKTLRAPTENGMHVQVDHGQKITHQAAAVVRLADHYLGTPYKWGGVSPKTGFDCSGFVQWLYGKAGVALPRTTYQQINVGEAVGQKNLRAGDIVFFSNKGDVHHEGLYIGGGQFIHAPHTGDVIKISSLSEPYYAGQFAGGRRVISR